MQPADAVLRFLESVGPKVEAEYYLRLFRSLPVESFAAIAVEPLAADESADSVAVDLRFLHALGLVPVVVLGLGEASADASRGRARRIELLLNAAGIPSRTLSGTDAAEVVDAVRAGAVPLCVFDAESEDDRVQRVAALCASLGTRKLIFLRPRGALRVGGERLSLVNLSVDFERLRAHADFEPRERDIVSAAHRLIFELVPHRLVVTVASPLDLLRELFTVKGAGTLFRRGAKVVRCEGLGGIDIARLRELLEASFGRPVDEAFFTRPLRHAYVEEGYRGAALVADAPFGSYLTKFAVTRVAQGEGIGEDLWSALAPDHPTLVWRARPDNPVRAWYERQCHGRVEAGGWSVYFRGLAPEAIPQAVAFALAEPVDFAW